MPKILLVDDDETVRYSLQRVLTHAGYEVVEAADGQQALARFASTRPDLIITDIVMPEQDGLGLLNSVRSRNTKVPILVISGGGATMGMDYLLMAQTMGADAILAKPFDNNVLLTKVARLLEPS